MDQLTRPLAEVRQGHRAAVGGKAAALGELTAAGIPVPPGFAVTTAAFRCALAAIDPGGLIPVWMEGLAPDDPAAIAEAAAQVRERILSASVPPQVHDAITTCYQTLGLTDRPAGPAPHASPGPSPAARERPGVPVAVRSSATGEDSDAASFAGLADTYLWVRGEDAVADHVRRCWASLYSAEAVSYRRRQELPEHGLAMGVVVQAMVDPRCAGVMFTRSPVTGDPSVVVVEASWGLGSALVSGEVTPDSYVVSKVTGEILRRTVSTKLRSHRRDASGTGVCTLDVPEHLRDVPCLADAEIQALARLGLRVSEHYGTPQDIEWAVTDDAPPGEPGQHGRPSQHAQHDEPVQRAQHGRAGQDREPGLPGGAAGQDDAGRRLVLLQSRPETVWSRRRTAPMAAPKARAFDHVLERLSLRGRREAGQ
jgi:pyruvate,water dikinase